MAPRDLARRLSSPRAMALLCVAVLGFSWALWLSSDQLAMRLNWDSANYVAKYASGAAGWADRPWNSHYAIGPAYWVGYWLARPFGGSFIDGVRTVNALGMAAAATLVAAAAMKLCGRVLLGALIALVYASSWGVAVLLLHMEDNVVYLPWVTATLALCVYRLTAWRARDSVLAGGLIAAGALISWQAGLYLFPALWVAGVLGGPGRSLPTRARDVGLIVVGFLATLFAWVAFYAATAPGLSFAELISTLFSRPQPSFFPESWRDVRLLVTGPRRIFRHLGTGLAQELGPPLHDSRFVQGRLPEIGLGFFVVCVAATAAATWVAVRKRRWSLQWLLLVLGVLTLVTSFYVDLPTDKYKRYEYLPLLLTLSFAALVGGLDERRWARAKAATAVGLALASLVVQSGLAVTWARDYRVRLPERSPPAYFGVGHEPWFVYLRRLRAKTPERCRYVFTLDELAHARYQLEIPAALWAEFPAHVALGDPAVIAKWRHRLNVVPLANHEPRACDHVSAAATRMLTATP